MVSPYFIRLICAGILCVCGIIVLALSADLESEIRSFGASTSWLPYAAFVGAFTLIVELIFIFTRMFASESLGAWVLVDLAWAGLMWVFWLAAAAVVSNNTAGCNDFNVASASCDKARADTAFLWIGWLVWFVIIGLLLWIGIREHRCGNRGVWQSPIGSHTTVYKRNAMTPGTAAAPGEAVMTERPTV